MLEELGVKPVINAAGTLTILGGSSVENDVIDAMKEVASVFVDMNELHQKAGAYIAGLTGAEDAYVTAGAAAGLVLSVAACMTRGQTARMGRLPSSRGMKSEVIVQRLHRNIYDYNLELPGATIKQIGGERRTTSEDLERGINNRTCAVAYFMYDPQDGVLPLAKTLEIAHQRKVPVIVDAAAELPPKENLTRFVKMNSDLVTFSCGKDMGAPNDCGIILGRKELVDICRRLGPQSYETVNSKLRVYIGRPMKTSKEDILAVITVLKKYLDTDHDEKLRKWNRKADYMVSKLSAYKSIRVKKVGPSYSHPRPVCIPRVQVELLHRRMTAEQLDLRLRRNEPSIRTYVMDGKLYLNPQCLKDGEEDILISTLSQLLGS